jgi:ABC-2 type transport system permease protein
MRERAAARPDVPRDALPDALPDAPLGLLLRPKWLTARARATRGERGRGARAAILGGTALLFWGLSFGVLHRLLQYFRGVEEIGPVLAGKLLGLLLVGFGSILLLSNVITALSSFFLAKDLDLLVAAPVDWLRVYGAKLLETLVASSWMVLLVAVPLLSAYGVVFDGGWRFALLCVAVLLPYFILPSAIGAAATLVLVNVFPARRTRDILSVIAVLSAAALVLVIRLVRPERLARPEGFRSLVEFVAVLRTPSSPLLPSEWAQQVLMGQLTGEPAWLPLYLLWTTAAAAVVLGALLHRGTYLRGYSKAQEGGQRVVSRARRRGLLHQLLSPWGVRRRELLLKEVRVFFRDTTQWSQLILLGVLVVVYVYNIKFLPLQGDGITFFLRNVVPFLNLVLAGFVLASVAARFLFPAVSLEGRTLWLLKTSPLRMRDLLWSKFWVGTLPLLALALGIVGVTDWLLQVSAFMIAVSLATIAMLTVALAGLAIAMGTLFPQFETENAAQIPTSFGGLLYMMASVALIAVVIMLEARPVYGYLSAQAFGTPAPAWSLVPWFGAAALVCVLATLVPLRIALTRLEEVER